MTSSSWPTVEQVAALGTALSLTAPPEAEDENGHVNVAYFYATHMRATDVGFAHTGFDESYRERTGHSIFSLEHHLRYYAEVMVGHEVSFHLRLLDRSDKIIHGMTILVNNSTGLIANTVEFVDAHVDLTTRRSHPMPNDLTDKIDRMIEAHGALAWHLPLSDVMGSRRPGTA